MPLGPTPDQVSTVLVMCTALAATASLASSGYGLVFYISLGASLLNVSLGAESLLRRANQPAAPWRDVLGLLAWGLHLSLGVLVVAEVVEPPEVALKLYKQGILSFFPITLFFSITDQAYARRVLPERWVLALAEFHVLLVWCIYTKCLPEQGVWAPLLHMHLPILVLPYLLHNHLPALVTLCGAAAARMLPASWCRARSSTSTSAHSAPGVQAAAAGSGGLCKAGQPAAAADPSAAWLSDGECDGDALAHKAHAAKLKASCDEAPLSGTDADGPEKPLLSSAAAAVPAAAAACAAARGLLAVAQPGQGQGVAASLLDSSGSLAAAAHMVQSPLRAYVSPLGSHTQVAFKVVSFDEPEDVPPGAATRLQGAVRDAAAGLGYDLQLEVLRVSMRRGCILIATDVLVTGAAANASQAGLLGSSAALALAASLLPSLLPRLGLRSDKHSSSRVGTSEHPCPRALPRLQLGSSITMQVGATRVRATWQGAPGWALALLPSHSPTAGSYDTLPRLGVVLPTAGARPTDEVLEEADAAQPSAARVWIVRLSVQVWGLRAGVQVLGSTPDVPLAGTSPRPATVAPCNYMTPSPAAVPAPVPGDAGVQLWVHCAAGHLVTRVLAATVPGAAAASRGPGSSREDAAGGVNPAAQQECPTVLEVEVEVPESALLRPHAGAAPMLLQPLSLELWAGEGGLADSAYVLLGPQQLPGLRCSKGAVWSGQAGVPCTGSSGCGKPARAAGLEVAALRELHAWSAQLLHAPWPGAGSAATCAQAACGHQALLRDLTYWLLGTQHTARASAGQAMRSPTSQQHPGDLEACQLHAWLPLQAPQLQVLGLALAAYTHAAGLTHVHHLVTAQQRMLMDLTRGGCIARGCPAAWSSWGDAAAAAAAAAAASWHVQRQQVVCGCTSAWPLACSWRHGHWLRMYVLAWLAGVPSTWCEQVRPLMPAQEEEAMQGACTQPVRCTALQRVVGQAQVATAAMCVL